jgi:hypothetical protein
MGSFWSVVKKEFNFASNVQNMSMNDYKSLQSDLTYRKNIKDLIDEEGSLFLICPDNYRFKYVEESHRIILFIYDNSKKCIASRVCPMKPGIYKVDLDSLDEYY